MFFTQAIAAMVEMGSTPEEIAECLDPVNLELEGRFVRSLPKEQQPGPHVAATYLEAFCETHGGPVPHVEDSSRLLFHDGWTFDALDPAGPAYPPPSDPSERRRLRTLYWETRQAVVAREADYLRGLLLDPRCEAVPGIFAPYRQQLTWCEQDMKRTTQALKELEDGRVQPIH